MKINKHIFTQLSVIRQQNNRARAQTKVYYKLRILMISILCPTRQKDNLQSFKLL